MRLQKESGSNGFDFKDCTAKSAEKARVAEYMQCIRPSCPYAATFFNMRAWFDCGFAAWHESPFRVIRFIPKVSSSAGGLGLKAVQAAKTQQYALYGQMTQIAPSLDNRPCFAKFAW